jgi:hypothetical protein
MAGPQELGSTGRGAVTLVTMGFFCFAGFMLQNSLIQRLYTGEQAELHMRVKEIKEQELAAIAAVGEREAAQRQMRE